MPRFVFALICAAFPTFALSDIQVSFRDGAPKDTFRIVNMAGCATGPVALTIDLNPSAGKLIFDVTSAGAGVEVFQPLELVRGSNFLAGVPDVVDGQKTLVLDIVNLPPNGEIAFTIDVDDTIGAREITVNGSEMGGSLLMLQAASTSTDAVFDTSAIARVQTPACVS